MEILVDQILGERYQIQSLLGRQTGRRTFLAWDLQTERSVVIKLLLFGPDFTWDDLKLFEREAEVLKSIDLPTIPQYLDCFDADTELGKGFVLVQTYIEAKSLQTWLDAGRTFSEGDLVSIATQLLTILDYLHNRHPAVIHRDIKPSNILLGDRSGNSPGQVYLVDFGSVKTAANGSTITVVGTYGYMPPEQFGGQTTPASDLYALGATIICLATGQHPSELPHRDMRIDFVDRVNLSSCLTSWLKSLTEISVDSRLKSASQALLALNAPTTNQEKILPFSNKPFGSNIKLRSTDRVFEISIPPKGFHFGLISKIGIAVFVNGFIAPFIFVGLVTFTNGGWMILLFMIPFVWMDSLFIWSILFDLFVTQKLRVDESEISLFSVMFGSKYLALTAPRQYLDRLELVPLTYAKDSDGVGVPAMPYINNRLELVPLTYAKDPYGVRVPVPPYINIWVGNQKFCLNKFNLTQPEQEWFVRELTKWLDLHDLDRSVKKERKKFPPLSNLNISSNKLER
jgi:serine/threonine protein kinase